LFSGSFANFVIGFVLCFCGNFLFGMNLWNAGELGDLLAYGLQAHEHLITQITICLYFFEIEFDFGNTMLNAA
jgi:hypothetical protein